jgi:hypothetical protein
MPQVSLLRAEIDRLENLKKGRDLVQIYGSHISKSRCGAPGLTKFISALRIDA